MVSGVLALLSLQIMACVVILFGIYAMIVSLKRFKTIDWFDLILTSLAGTLFMYIT